MTLNITKQLASIHRMAPCQLQEKYAEVFGEQPRSRNKKWLLKRIAWRLQANAEGDLSDRARHRALELANDADLRVSEPRKPKCDDNDNSAKTASARNQTNRRLPMPGTVITRPYKGETIEVKVLLDSFEYQGDIYKSLSAVAKAVTGTHWNGYHFFGLRNKENGS